MLDFLAERLRVQLRAEGARHDVLAAVLGTGLDDDLVRLLARTDAVAALLGTETAPTCSPPTAAPPTSCASRKRRTARMTARSTPPCCASRRNKTLAGALDRVEPAIAAAIGDENFAGAMAGLAALRAPLDAFFDQVTVNDPRAGIAPQSPALARPRPRRHEPGGRFLTYRRIEQEPEPP